MKHLRICLLLILVLLIGACGGRAGQEVIVEPVREAVNTVLTAVDTQPSPPKLSLIDEYMLAAGLIDIADSLPAVVVDLRYSTANNFLGFDFYGDLDRAYMQPECYRKVRKAYDLLQAQKPGFSFIIFDAARSRQAQQLMWDSVDYPERLKHIYVANPSRGSIHNYGMAVDMSIVDTAGNQLDMGTNFDCFDKLSNPKNSELYFQQGLLSQQQYDNRQLLLSIMKQAGMYVSNSEWWHFNAASLNYAKNKYNIIDINIDSSKNDHPNI